MCVNGWESEDPFSVNSYESEYPKNDESGNIYESGKISSSVNLVLDSFITVDVATIQPPSAILPVIYTLVNFLKLSHFTSVPASFLTFSLNDFGCSIVLFFFTSMCF